MLRLDYFKNFNESEEPGPPIQGEYDPERYDKNEDAVIYQFLCGSGLVTMLLRDELKSFTLHLPNNKEITCTYDSVVPEKEKIIGLFSKEEQGTFLYHWILRVLSLSEGSKQPEVSKWLA